MSTVPVSQFGAPTPQFWGRAWKLTVELGSGPKIEVTSSDYGDEALKISFEVEQMALQAYWWADITIYNLNENTEQLFLGAAADSNITQGAIVTLSAGYQRAFAPGNNIIFTGRVFQPMWERENVTDFKLTLRCAIGFFEDALNYISFAWGVNATQLEIIRDIAASSRTSIPVERIDEAALSSKRLARGKTIAGRPFDCMAQVARDNNLQIWISDKGLNIRKLIPDSSVPDLVYGPPYVTDIANSQSTSGLTKQTIIGTPQQTQQGVAFRVLLDSDLKIGLQVKIDMRALRQLPLTPGQGYPPLLDRDGVYVIAGVRHVGDTRGNEWTSEITAVSRNWSQLYSAVAPNK